MNDAWAVGGGGTTLHWNGTVWSSVPSGTTETLYGVWGSGPNDVWAVTSAGDLWRLFLGRYEKLMLNGQETHVGWAWDKVGTDDNHFPERFTPISFSSEYVEDLR